MSLIRTVTVTLTLAGCASGGDRQTQPWIPRTEAARQALTARIGAFADEIGATGATGVLAVTVDGKPTFVQAIGRGDDGVTLSDRTAFDIGSISKQFTAAAILALEAEGKLRTTDPVSTHLPDAPAAWASMTVHHLLTHSSGLPPQFGDDYETLDRAGFLARAFQTPLATPPGEQYEYSNIGYSLLAAIIELRSGVSYEQYLKRALFDKAGMTETGYRLPNFRPEAVAIGYRRGSRWGRPTEQPWAADGPYWNLRGNGGILSTAADMLRWHEALSGTAVLSEESKRRMYTRHIEEGPGAGTYYGYGWALFPTTRGTTLITHNGGNGSFFADFLRYPDERVVVFFATNRAAPSIRSVAHTVARIVFDSTFVARLAPAPAESATIPDTPAGGSMSAVRVLGLPHGDRWRPDRRPPSPGDPPGRPASRRVAPGR